MNYTKEQRCSETFMDGWQRRQCMKGAVITRDNKPYCGIHDPEYIEKKNEKSRQKYERELNLRVAERVRELNLRVAERIAGESCHKINPDNPRAVAESIGDMYNVLKRCFTYLEALNQTVYPSPLKLREDISKVLAKVEDK